MDDSGFGASLGNEGVDVKFEVKILDSNTGILVVVDDRHYVCIQLRLPRREFTVFIFDVLHFFTEMSKLATSDTVP